MNKIAKRIMTVAAALALVVVLGVCMTACGGSKSTTLSMGDCVKNLLDNGYDVRISVNVDDINKQLPYIVEEINEGAAGLQLENFELKIEEDTVTHYGYANKEIINKEDESKNVTYGIQVMKFTNEDQAKAFADKLQTFVNAMEEIKETDPMYEYYKDYLGQKVSREGTIVMFGSSEAINAAK